MNGLSGLMEEMEKRERGMGGVEVVDRKGFTSLDLHGVMHQHCP